MNDGERGEFVSHATAWDRYVGSKDWSELKTAQQDVLLIHETYGNEKFDPNNFIMEMNLRKMQAQGIRSIVTACYIIAERSGLKEEKPGVVWDEDARMAISMILNQTAFGKRLNEAWSTLDGSKHEFRTPLDSGELAAVAQHGFTPSPLDSLLDLEWPDAQEALTRFLSPAPKIPTAKRDRPAPVDRGRTMFGLGKKIVKAGDAARSLALHVTSIEACQRMSGMMRPCKVPDGVLLAEIAFLRCSALDYAIERVVHEERQQHAMHMTTGMTLIELFDGEEKDAPREVLAHYGFRDMGNVVHEAIAAYSDRAPMLTAPTFVHRVNGFGEMTLEIRPLIDEVVGACESALRSVKLTLT